MLTGAGIVTDPALQKPGDLVVPAGMIPTIHNVDGILKAAKDQVSFLDTPEHETRRIMYPWHLFQYNDWALRQDMEIITRNRKSAPIPESNRVTGADQIFMEPGAVMEHCILNASTGPIYIGKNATVMEGCMIRGPLALCEGAVLKMGTKVYGASTLGPFCTGGGEIRNSILMAYSNKAHDGYLGDSVIGAWCNLGAGTSNSNVKNTGSPVKYHIADDLEPVTAGPKAGLIMGDYSRSAINTSFNTGTIIGVCCNIFGNDIPPKLIPSFSWGDERYDIEKAIQDITNWKKMKGLEMSDEEKQLLYELYVNIK